MASRVSIGNQWENRRVCVCVGLCVCWREGKRKRQREKEKRQREKEKKRRTQKLKCWLVQWFEWIFFVRFVCDFFCQNFSKKIFLVICKKKQKRSDTLLIINWAEKTKPIDMDFLSGIHNMSFQRPMGQPFWNWLWTMNLDKIDLKTWKGRILWKWLKIVWKFTRKR